MPGNAILLTEDNVYRSAAPSGAVKAAGIFEPSSTAVGIWTLPRETSIEGSWKLGADLVIEIRTGESGYVAIHHAVDKYGIGATFEEAIRDLLASFIDYRMWLEKHQSGLAGQERQALRLLQTILKKA